MNTSAGLSLRAMDALEMRLLPGTEGTLTTPFFSPDGRSLGYWDVNAGQLKRVALSGGAPLVIGPASSPYGASWEPGGTILFGQREGILRVPATGGTPELVIATADGERMDGPQLLPDGDAVLFSVTASDWDAAQVVVQSLSTGTRTVLIDGGSDARYLPTGHLVYALEDGLFAVAFDLARLAVRGGPVSVVQGLMRATFSASANYGVSEDGTLVYVTASAPARTLAWVDREGREEPLATAAAGAFSGRPPTAPAPPSPCWVPGAPGGTIPPPSLRTAPSSCSRRGAGRPGGAGGTSPSSPPRARAG